MNHNTVELETLENYWCCIFKTHSSVLFRQAWRAHAVSRDWRFYILDIYDVRRKHRYIFSQSRTSCARTGPAGRRRMRSHTLGDAYAMYHVVLQRWLKIAHEKHVFEKFVGDVVRDFAQRTKHSDVTL